jgi:hypothetical protein
MTMDMILVQRKGNSINYLITSIPNSHCIAVGSSEAIQMHCIDNQYRIESIR